MKALEDILTATFADFTLSGGEKFALRETLVGYHQNGDALRFARNCAFQIVQQHMRTSTQRHGESVKWLEQVVKLVEQLLAPDEKRDAAVKAEAFFSPGTECVNQLIHCIERVQRTLDVCVFTISDDSISEALLAVHKRNGTVRIISDDEKALDAGSDVARLAKAGIPVKYDNDPGHMHHKFAVFDNRYVINGSFNWTRSASHNNCEDMVINNHPQLVDAFVQRFAYLWSKF